MKPSIDLSGIKDPIVRRVLTRMKEFLETGEGRTKATGEAWIKRSDLGNSEVLRKLVNGLKNNEIPVPYVDTDDGTDTVDLTPPPTPTGFRTIDGYDSVYMVWDKISDPRIGFVEIYRATSDNRSQAVAIGYTIGTIFRDTDVIRGQTYYYWIRNINKWSAASAPVYSDYNAIAGTPGQASIDPADLLAALTDQLTETQLVQSLRDRIDQVDAPGVGLIDSLAQEIQNRVNAILAEAADRVNGDALLQADIDTINLAIGDPSTGLAAAHTKATLLEGRIDDVDGQGTTVEGLAAAVEALEVSSGSGGALAQSAYDKAVANETRINNVDGTGKTVEALASDQSSLQATVEDGTTGLAATRVLATGVQSRINDVNGAGRTVEVLSDQVDAQGVQINDGSTGLAAAHTRSTTIEGRMADVGSTGRTMEALGVDFNSLKITFEDPTNGHNALVSAVDQIEIQINDGSSGLTALANDINQLFIDLGDAEAAIQTESTLRAQETGELYAQYSVKLDVNGNIAGFGLSSTATAYDDQVHSQFVVAVDTFAVGAPGATAFSLIVDNNVVVMNGAYIQDATITSAKILSVAVDTIVGDVATFIEGNFENLESTNFDSANQIGWKFNVDGTHEIYGGAGSKVYASHMRADAVEIVDAINLKPNAVTIWSLVQQPSALLIEPTTDPANETILFDAYIDFTDAQANAPLQIICSMAVYADLPDPQTYPQSGFNGRFNLYRNGTVIWGTDLGHNPMSGTMSSLFNSAETIPVSSAAAFTTWISLYQISGRFDAGHDDIFYDAPGPGVHHYQWRFCGYVHTGAGQTFNSAFKWHVGANSRYMKFDGGKR